MSKKLKKANKIPQLRLIFVVFFIVLIMVLIIGVMLLPQKTERVDGKSGR